MATTALLPYRRPDRRPGMERPAPRRRQLGEGTGRSPTGSTGVAESARLSMRPPSLRSTKPSTVPP
ncbi:MAG: hypothetical protein K0R38_7454 [Polyangiaceae bacterium]|nr:hypothetical protein [Polyangiaceae bacterium]